jgi:hypothetical protein
MEDRFEPVFFCAFRGKIAIAEERRKREGQKYCFFFSSFSFY